MAPSRVKYAISKSCVNSSASVGHASSHSPQNMHREVSYVKKVSTLRRVASSRSQPTTIRFSGHASAHKLHPMHSVSPVSGLLFSRGAPRYRSATIGRSSGYCSVTMFLGFCARKVTARPFKKSTWNNRSRSSRMRVVSFATTSLSSNCCTTEIGSRDAGAVNCPGSHFAVVQKDCTDQHDTRRPEPRHRVSRSIFWGQPQLQPARPARRNRQNRQRNMAQFGQHLFLDVSQSVRMRKQQRAGDSHEDGKNESYVWRRDAARLHAPLKNSESDHQQHEDSMEQNFRISKCNPESVRPERPNFRIAAQEQKYRQAKKRQRPVARPGNLACLREKRKKSNAQNDDARP